MEENQDGGGVETHVVAPTSPLTDSSKRPPTPNASARREAREKMLPIFLDQRPVACVVGESHVLRLLSNSGARERICIPNTSKDGWPPFGA